MVKFVGIVTRRPGMSREAFLRYWREVHGPLAAALPGLRRYVQNPPVEVAGREPRYDGVAELWFDDLESLRAAFRTPQGERVRADESQFIDQARSFAMIVEEQEVSLSAGGRGA